MKISRLLALVAAGVALANGNAYAQAKNFEGLSIGLNYLIGKTNFTCASPQPQSPFLSVSCTGGSGEDRYVTPQAQYFFLMNDAVILGVGGTYGIGGIGSKAIFKDYYTLDITTGYAMSEKTLVYGKFSYLGNTAYSSTSNTRVGNGMGFGLGVRQLFMPKIYFQAEYLYNKFNDVGTGIFVEGGTSNALTLGVGYQF